MLLVEVATSRSSRQLFSLTGWVVSSLLPSSDLDPAVSLSTVRPVLVAGDAARTTIGSKKGAIEETELMSAFPLEYTYRRPHLWPEGEHEITLRQFMQEIKLRQNIAVLYGETISTQLKLGQRRYRSADLAISLNQI